MITKTEIAAFALSLLFAFSIGVYVGRPASQPVTMLPAEVLELSHANFQAPVNPNDAVLWSAFLPQAKLCTDCTALMEYSDSSMHSIRPVVVSMRDTNDSSVGYTMVVGTIGWVPGQRSVQPTVTYYIGHRSGALARVSSNGDVMFRYGANDWRPADNPELFRDQARQFFNSRWQTQLAAAKH